MKWTNMIVVIVLIIVLGWIVNGFISCGKLKISGDTEYSYVPATMTMNTTSLGESGYFAIEDEIWVRRGPCEICEAIQSGNITPSGLEINDNFTLEFTSPFDFEKEGWILRK